MALYADGHPARERAIDLAYEELRGVQEDTAQPLFTFLGDEVVFGRQPLRDMKAWDGACASPTQAFSVWNSRRP